LPGRHTLTIVLGLVAHLECPQTLSRLKEEQIWRLKNLGIER